MTKGRVTYYDPWEAEQATCDACGWSGLGKEASVEYFEVVADVRCPECDRKLFMISNATAEEMRRAAAEGNEDAKFDLQMLEEVVDRSHAAVNDERLGRDNLPDLEGDALSFTFTVEGGSDWMSPTWLVLSSAGREVYREHTGYEGWAEIIAISEKVLARYARRVSSIDPGAAGAALGGDNLSYSTHIQTFLEERDVAPPSGPWSRKDT